MLVTKPVLGYPTERETSTGWNTVVWCSTRMFDQPTVRMKLGSEPSFFVNSLVRDRKGKYAHRESR